MLDKRFVSRTFNRQAMTINSGAGASRPAIADCRPAWTAVPILIMYAVSVASWRVSRCFSSLTLRVPQDIAQGVWNLPADSGAFGQLQDGLQQLIDEDMLDHYFGAVVHENQEPSADRV